MNVGPGYRIETKIQKSSNLGSVLCLPPFLPCIFGSQTNGNPLARDAGTEEALAHSTLMVQWGLIWKRFRGGWPRSLLGTCADPRTKNFGIVHCIATESFTRG
jgi:hypothetical protein